MRTQLHYRSFLEAGSQSGAEFPGLTHRFQWVPLLLNPRTIIYEHKRQPNCRLNKAWVAHTCTSPLLNYYTSARFTESFVIGGPPGPRWFLHASFGSRWRVEIRMTTLRVGYGTNPRDPVIRSLISRRPVVRERVHLQGKKEQHRVSRPPLFISLHFFYAISNSPARNWFLELRSILHQSLPADSASIPAV